jgi:hypothetical protein
MLRKLRPRSVYDVMAAIACVVALTGGTAYAANTIRTGDIVDNEVFTTDVRDDTLGFGGLTHPDLNPGSVRSSEVLDNALTGADINEGSLGTVTSSVLGGVGRSGLRQNGQPGPGGCDPETGGGFINCDIGARLNLPRPARVLVIGSVIAVPDAGSGGRGAGDCELGTTSGAIPGSRVQAVVDDTSGGLRETEPLTIAGVTGVFPAGQQHAFGIDCSEFIDGIQFLEAQVTAVALSDR